MVIGTITRTAIRMAVPIVESVDGLWHNSSTS
jgi:hypothetical protein